MVEIVLVIPCFNEATRLDRAAFVNFARERPSVRFLMVNDGSTDGTLDVLHSLVDQAPGSFEVLDVQPNQGKAEAVRRGMFQAMDSGVEFVAYWDADLATPLEAVIDFLEVARSNPGVQIVVGSRIRLLGRRIQRRARRHYLGRVFATFASLLLRLPIYDTQCGAKLFRVTPFNRSLFGKPFMAGWIFDVELLLRFMAGRQASGLPEAESCIVEIPLMTWVDVAGSKVKPSAFFLAPWQLCRLWHHYGRGGCRQRPS